MSKINNLQLVEIFQRAVRENWGYVWGKNGEVYTQTEAQRLTDRGAGVPDGRSKLTYWIKDCAKWIGRMVADCSGGIVYAIRQFDPTFKDHNSTAFKARFVKSGPISDIPEIPGLLLWRQGHIGVYAGDGIMYEFRGTAYGAVATKLKDRGMTLWGMPDCIEYVTEAAPLLPRQMTVVTKADPLKLRAAPADGEVLAKMPKGAPVWAIDQTDVDDGTWYRVIYFDGTKYWDGWAFGGLLK